jgi:ECF sigma factor
VGLTVSLIDLMDSCFFMSSRKKKTGGWISLQLFLRYNRNNPGSRFGRRIQRFCKRNSTFDRLSLSALEASAEQPDLGVIALDQALTELAALDTRKSRIVQLKVVGGMTTDEIAEALKISDATVERKMDICPRLALSRTRKR